jgi:acyl-CoA synthetase (AMP-forming)/AMP-acid ligase II
MTAYFGQLSPGDRIGAMGLPPFHSFGMTMQLYLPLAYLATVAVYPPLAITDLRAVPIVPTSDNILDSVRRTHCMALVAVPTFLEQWAASAEAVEALTKLDRVVSVVSTSIDGTPDRILRRSGAVVHLRKRLGMRCGLPVSTSASRTVGRNLVAPLLLAGEEISRMESGCGYASRTTSR